MANNRKNNKSTADQKEKMILESAEYIFDNDVTRPEFVKWFMAKYDKRERMAYEYWKWGWERCTKLREDKIQDRRTKRIIQLEHKANKLSAEGQHKDAAQIIMMIAKLEGLDVHKVEMDANINKPKSIFEINPNILNKKDE